MHVGVDDRVGPGDRRVAPHPGEEGLNLLVGAYTHLHDEVVDTGDDGHQDGLGPGRHERGDAVERPARGHGHVRDHVQAGEARMDRGDDPDRTGPDQVAKVLGDHAARLVERLG